MKALVKNATIEIYAKNVYGIEKFYIKDDEIAGCITAINSKKTIDDTDMKNLTTLFGITWKEVLPPKK